VFAFLRRRGLAPFVGSTLYATIASVRSNATDPRSAWTAGLIGIALSIAATRPASPAAEAERRRKPTALDASAYALWGLGLTVVSLAGGSPWVDALGTVGVSVAVGAGCLAPRALPRPLGVAASLPHTRQSVTRLALVLLVIPPAVSVMSCMSIEVALYLVGGRGPGDSLGAPSAVFALAVLIAVYGDRLRVERLVLGRGERARAALGGALSVFVIAIAVVITRAASASEVLRVGAAVSGLLAALAISFWDAALLARMGRRALALLLFGGPVVLLSAIAAEGFGGAGPVSALVGGVLALAVGTLGAWLERPLRPAEGRWLDAMTLAQSALARADPETSVESALAALRAAAGTSAESPELWSLDPTRVVTIDAAGYARERDAALPPLLLEIASAEPEATVRVELLEALLVRRPDLRPLARWMDERGALAATLVTREGETTGALVVPRGSRQDPVTLEEARALKALADAMSGACAGKSALVRSRARERDASVRADAAEHDLERRRHAEALASERVALGVAERVRGVDVGRYSPAMRLAQDALDRRVGARAPVVVVAPAGLDPVPHLAAAHLAGTGRGTPFVVVDAAASQEHDPKRWGDPAHSPLALAHTGLLVLQDGPALPASVQRLIGAALAERRAPWEQAEPLDVSIAVTCVCPSKDTSRAEVTTGATQARLGLDPALVGRLGEGIDAEVVLPALRERPEDLRALLIDRLAREGLRQKGTPVGIDDAAFALLSDYPFPGDHAELVLLSHRLVERVVGDVVRVDDVLALGLTSAATLRINVRASRGVS
jgi:hypothetical protein